MKHLLIIATLLVTAIGITPAMAQKDEAKRFEHKAEHMSQILRLDDATATRFQTIYNQYRQEMRTARQTHARIRPLKNKGEAPARLTDEQVKKNIENSFALSQSILDIRKKYYKEYLKILTPRQIERLYDLEKKNGEHIREMAKKPRKK